MLSPSRFRRALRGAEESQRRPKRERGAAALEFALIAPFFFLVVFGGIEIGFMFRSNLALEDTARTAARVASVERAGADADLEILRKVNARVGSLNGDVSRVVIFAADTLDSEVPGGCTGDFAASSQADRCNVYTVVNGDLQAVVDGFVQETGINPAVDRQAWDNIGVHIEYDYDYVTGFFDTITLSSSAVEVIELDL